MSRHINASVIEANELAIEAEEERWDLHFGARQLGGFEESAQRTI